MEFLKKSLTGKKKSSWSLRETDRFDIICGVNGNVYFSVHFEGFILRKIRHFPLLLAVMFSSKRPINAKSAYNVIFGMVSGIVILLRLALAHPFSECRMRHAAELIRHAT